MPMKKLGLVLYDLEEAAKMLGVSYETVRKYARQGRLRAVRVGRRYRVEEGAIRDLLRAQAPAASFEQKPVVGEKEDYRKRLRDSLALVERLAPIIEKGTLTDFDPAEVTRSAREERMKRIAD